MLHMIIHGDCSRSGTPGKGRPRPQKDFCLLSFYSSAECAALTIYRRGVCGGAGNALKFAFCNRMRCLGERTVHVRGQLPI